MNREPSPRPWRVTQHGMLIVDAAGKRVALMEGSEDVGLDAANAALIVAAVNALAEEKAARAAEYMAAFGRALQAAVNAWAWSPAPPATEPCFDPLHHAPGCECGTL